MLFLEIRKILARLGGNPLTSVVPAGPATRRQALDSALNPCRVRECDDWLSGWFADDGTLYPGFEVGAGDIVLTTGGDNPAIDAFLGRMGARHAVLAGDAGAVEEATRIICLDEIGSASDPAAVCEKLASLGRPGAKFLIGAPSKTHARLHDALAPEGEVPLRGFDRDELCRLVEESGLTIVHQASDGFFWSIYLVFLWHAQRSFAQATSLVEAWAGTWADTLAGRDGMSILATLNDLLPYRHLIVASNLDRGTAPVVVGAGARTWPGHWTVVEDPAVDDVDPWLLLPVNEAAEGWFDAGAREVVPLFPVCGDDVVLDLGCGDSGAAAFCAALGAHIILADIDAAVLERNGQRVQALSSKPVETLVGNSEHLPIESGCVSRIVCTEVLEHVDDPDAVMAELVRVGSNDALYLLTVPGERGEHVQKRLAHPSYFERPNHIRIMSEREFRSLVERAGLEIVRYSEDGFYVSFLFAILWQTGRWMGDKVHSASLWARTWQMVLESEDAKRTIGALNGLVPKRQVIVARKA